LAIFDVCICTHSPDESTMAKVIDALVSQDIGASEFEVLIIDNKSHRPIELTKEPYSKLSEAGIRTQVMREENLGVAHARIRAIKETNKEFMVFVDDDNVLAPDFLTQAKNVLETYPDVGCFSGRISFPEKMNVPGWITPLQTSLAVRECGNENIIDFFRGDWKPWVPTATASMVVRRQVLDIFMKNHGQNPRFFDFGRKGKTNLTSGEDYFIAISAADVEMKCGYFPKLRMWHWLRPKRFSFWYVAKLMGTYGITELMRTDYLKLPLTPFNTIELK
jgi:GT2 family glycosyltransferase